MLSKFSSKKMEKGSRELSDQSTQADERTERPRSRSIFTSADGRNNQQTNEFTHFEGQKQLQVPKPIIIKNFVSENFPDLCSSSESPPAGTIITPQGIIVLYLPMQIRIDITLKGAIRISNVNQRIVLALAADGTSSGLIHPNGRVHQYGSRVEIMAIDPFDNNKLAKMWYKGVSFTSLQCPLVYLVDSAGTRTTHDVFNNLNEDFTLEILFEGSKPTVDQNPTDATRIVNEVLSILQNTAHWINEDGTTNWIINNIRISQTADGLIRISRNGNKFCMRTSPTNGSASISSPYIHCTGSLGLASHLFVRRGERRMHYDGSTFVVRNAGHSAGFDEFHQLKVY